MDISNLNMSVKVKGVEEAIEKATLLTEKIIEAKKLAGELAKILGDMEIEV